MSPNLEYRSEPGRPTATDPSRSPLEQGHVVFSAEPGRWCRTESGSAALESVVVISAGPFSSRVVADFDQAFAEARLGLFGSGFTQGTGEHRSRAVRRAGSRVGPTPARLERRVLCSRTTRPQRHQVRPVLDGHSDRSAPTRRPVVRTLIGAGSGFASACYRGPCMGCWRG
jgi:hypothetical protein